MKHNLMHGNCYSQRATGQRRKNKQETDEGLWGLSGCGAPAVPLLPGFST